MRSKIIVKRITFLALTLAVILLVQPNARATVIPAYFGWNYVFESGVGPPPVLELTSFTYTGGAGAGLVMGLPAFPGFGGMPDVTGLGAGSVPTFFTGGDGETTRTIGVTLGIDWVPAGTAVPWSLAPLPYPSIGITGLTTLAGGAPFKTYAGFPPTPTGSLHYVLGLIPAGAGTELLSFLLPAQGDIYGPFLGAAGNPTLTATDIGGSGTIITVSFGAAAVPEPGSLLLIGTGLLGLISLKQKWRK